MSIPTADLSKKPLSLEQKQEVLWKGKDITPLSSILLGAAVGGAMGSLLGPLGTAAGAIVGVAIGIIAGYAGYAIALNLHSKPSLPVSSNLGIVTYNKGTNIRDFGFTCDHNKIKTTEEGYSIAKRKTADFFESSVQEGLFHAVLLQETDNAVDHPLIETLEKKGFELFHILNNQENPERIRNRGNFDTAIMLDKNRFKDFKNHSTMVTGYDAAIVSATDKETEKRVLFCSLHVPGCILDEARVIQADARDGDDHVQGALEVISNIVKAAGEPIIQFIGADMNANPEKLNQNQTEKTRWDHRFIKLEKAGFKTHRTNAVTQVYPKSKAYPERELDFVYLRAPISVQVIETKPLLSFNLDPETKLPKNSSDHLPVLTRVII